MLLVYRVDLSLLGEVDLADDADALIYVAVGDGDDLGVAGGGDQPAVKSFVPIGALH